VVILVLQKFGINLAEASRLPLVNLVPLLDQCVCMHVQKRAKFSSIYLTTESFILL